MSKEFIEGLKETLRTGIIAVLPVLIDSIQKGFVDWRVILVAFVLAVLKGIDKWVHLSDVQTPLDLKFIK
jgi:hypothetical protein